MCSQGQLARCLVASGQRARLHFSREEEQGGLDPGKPPAQGSGSPWIVQSRLDTQHLSSLEPSGQGEGFSALAQIPSTSSKAFYVAFISSVPIFRFFRPRNIKKSANHLLPSSSSDQLALFYCLSSNVTCGQAFSRCQGHL